MKTEIEAKFLNIEPDDIRRRLADIGAVCKQPMRMMRRVVFDNDDMNAKRGFIRVRDEGYRVSVTYKQYDEMSLTGAKEIEFTTDNYDAAVALIEATGIRVRSYQEARREIWVVQGAEVVIDEWPWLNPFIEIEAETESRVKDIAKLLGFDWMDAAFGDVMTAYRAQYPSTGMGAEDMVYNLPLVRFEDATPSILKA
jgi:adenylate cyclase class 2